MNDLTDANNLYEAMKKSVKTARWKATSQRFEYEWLLNIAEIQEELIEHRYKTGEKSVFITRERGKARLIRGNCIKDRIVRHVLCDNVLIPELDKYLIYDNAASRAGKGIDFARKRVRKHLHEFYKEQGNKGYVLLTDFSKFFDNIRHDIVYEMIAEKVSDPLALEVLRDVIDSMAVDVSYMSDDEYSTCMDSKFDSVKYADKISRYCQRGEKILRKSACVGDQTSQLFGIFFPYKIDNLCKIVHSAKHYIRYMDDILIIHESKEKLHAMMDDIRKISADLGIFINEKKTVIVPVNKPFRFLQNSYFLTDTGKVVERINPKKLTSMRRRIKKLARKEAIGDLESGYTYNVGNSWLCAHQKVMSKMQIQHFKNLLDPLDTGGNDGKRKNDNSP